MNPPCSQGSPSTDGMGVPDADYILYISANQNLCTATTIAFAGVCQMESTQDRPIAGYINFCPNSLEETTRDFLYDVAKHEVIHALAFSSSLFPFWRDSNGDPRTPRNSFQLPPVDPVYALRNLFAYMYTCIANVGRLLDFLCFVCAPIFRRRCT